MSREMTSVDVLRSCTLCPRECGIDRTIGEVGICGAGDTLRVARAALHFWEEPVISGTRGSGTVFFSHCALGCVYCQNKTISGGDVGREIPTPRLVEIFHELRSQGAHNINLVTPTHYVPQIKEAIQQAKSEGVDLPFVYNTSGYERLETLRQLDGLIDIYLTDFKYADNQIAFDYSSTSDYVERAQTALDEMVRQVGEPMSRTGCDGEADVMQKGVVVRHLLLPGRMDDACHIVSYVHRRYGRRVLLSLMNQYTPVISDSRWPELSRSVEREEYETLLGYADSLGIEDYFWQEGGAVSESFIPAFDNTGV